MLYFLNVRIKILYIMNYINLLYNINMFFKNTLAHNAIYNVKTVIVYKLAFLGGKCVH